MPYRIVTNNPQVLSRYPQAFFVEGDMEAVLRHVRDLVYQGYRLISMPLPASLKLLYSPYRSVLISDDTTEDNLSSAEIIGNSYETFLKTRGKRREDSRHHADYAAVDLLLLEEAIAECRR